RLRADESLPVDEEGRRAADAQPAPFRQIGADYRFVATLVQAGVEGGAVQAGLGGDALQGVHALRIARPLVLAGEDQVVHLPVGLVAALLAGTARRLVRLLRLGVDAADGVILEDVAHLPGV